jgi:uncharacterized membrane protein
LKRILSMVQESELIPGKEVRAKGLKGICILALILGILFRFINLDKKVYWHDEVYTSLEISAHSRSELVTEVFNGREVGIRELQKYQQIDPNRTLGQMIRSLGIEDTQHPPLFYVIARYWVKWWGDSVTATRSIAALISLLIFPCIYWLCLELFKSPLTGWISIALVAVSPFHVLYAQEAREYSLWTVTILLSSLALLGGLRRRTWQSWGFYTVSLILALYTFLLSILVAIDHGIYVGLNKSVYPLSTTGFGLSRRAIAYLISTTIALVAFIPWLYFVFNYYDQIRATTGWTEVSLSFLTLAKLWFVNFSRIFVDFDLNPFKVDNPLVYGSLLPILLLEAYAVYFVCRYAPKPVWSFVVTLTGVTVVLLILPDLLIGGQRSGTTRYLIPSYLGIQLAVAYLLASQLDTVTIAHHQFWKFMTVLLLAVGVISCAVSSSANTWWNKGVSYNHPRIAHIVNASDRPLVVSDAYGINPGNVVSLSYLVNKNVRFLLLPEVSVSPDIPEISNEFSDVFFLNLPDFFRSKIEEQYNAKIVPLIEEFWRLER